MYHARSHTKSVTSSKTLQNSFSLQKTIPTINFTLCKELVCYISTVTSLCDQPYPCLLLFDPGTSFFLELLASFNALLSVSLSSSSPVSDSITKAFLLHFFLLDACSFSDSSSLQLL